LGRRRCIKTPPCGLCRGVNRIRLASTHALLVAALAITGGGLILPAGPAAADPGTTCASGSGVADLTRNPPILTFRLVGCGQRSGVMSWIVDVTGGEHPATIAWSSGKAMSTGTTRLTNIDFTGSGCPAGDIAADLVTTLTGGVYGNPPTSGVTHLCLDDSRLPALAASAAPVHL